MYAWKTSYCFHFIQFKVEGYPSCLTLNNPIVVETTTKMDGQGFVTYI